MSAYTYELDDKDKENLSSFANCSLSTTMYKKTNATISTYVENPNLSDAIYDGFTPIVKSINVGFYAVPMLCDYAEYMDEVDARDPNWMYVDKIKWVVDEASDHLFPDNVYPVRMN